MHMASARVSGVSAIDARARTRAARPRATAGRIVLTMPCQTHAHTTYTQTNKEWCRTVQAQPVTGSGGSRLQGRDAIDGSTEHRTGRRAVSGGGTSGGGISGGSSPPSQYSGSRCAPGSSGAWGAPA
eukprot:scaffold112870_cov66-Phaeocystis_antarctica.AAC.3